MTLATPKTCAQLCARLADLKKERSVIEARRAAKERVGVNNPDDEANDTDQLQGVDDEIVSVQQSLETKGCDCDKDAADGGASPGLSPSPSP